MLQNTLLCQLVQIQHWMKGSENDLERLGSKWSAAVVSTRDVSWRRRGGNRPKLSPPAAAGPPPPPQTHPEKGLAVEILPIACSAGREGVRAPVASAVQQDQSTAINFLQGLLPRTFPLSNAPIITRTRHFTHSSVSVAKKSLIYVMAGNL